MEGNGIKPHPDPLLEERENMEKNTSLCLSVISLLSRRKKM